MSTSDNLKAQSREIARQTADYVRANPIPAVVSAVAVGFALGLVARSLEARRQPEPIRDALDELRHLIDPLARQAQRAGSDATEAVREVVEQAVERVRELEPVAGWWKRLWS